MIEQSGGGRVAAGGVVVDDRALVGLAAADACIRVASAAVAKRALRVYVGDNEHRVHVQDSWQARLFGAFPNRYESWFLILEQTEASLTARNNAYWLKRSDPRTGEVVSVQVIPPADVHSRWNPVSDEPEYRIRTAQGSATWTDWLTRASVLHFRVGYPTPGQIVAPTPVELHREMIGAGVSRGRYESALYTDGILEGIAVSFPKDVSPEQARKYRDAFQSEHGGIAKVGRVRVFGGGPTVSKIGLSLQDAEFVASKQMTAREVCQILGVPASLIDANDATTRPLTPEHEEDRFARHQLEPRLARIQETIRQDPSFFGVGTDDYPAFADVLVRADVATESARLVREVHAGIRLADEARALMGLPPLPGGAGKVPQVVPVGGMENPDPVDPYVAAGGLES